MEELVVVPSAGLHVLAGIVGPDIVGAFAADELARLDLRYY